MVCPVSDRSLAVIDFPDAGDRCDLGRQLTPGQRYGDASITPAVDPAPLLGDDLDRVATLRSEKSPRRRSGCLGPSTPTLATAARWLLRPATRGLSSGTAVART